MRVLFLAHSVPRHLGKEGGAAAGALLLRLAVALREEGVEVQIIAPAGRGAPGAEQLGGVQIERFRSTRARVEPAVRGVDVPPVVRDSWTARLTMLGVLGSEFASAVHSGRRFQPDLVHAHWWFPGGLVGTWVASLANVPLVTTLHGRDVRLVRRAVAARPVLRHVLKRSAAVTTPSPWLAREIATMVPTVAPTVAPMPIDTDRFTPDGARSADRLLTIASPALDADGARTLVTALARMHARAALDVVTDEAGKGEGDAARAAIDAQARDAGVADRVAWHGHPPPDVRLGLYRRAAALVVGAHSEAQPQTVAEAQLCATPVVALDVDGAADLVRHAHTGALVPAGDPGALAATLDDLLAHPDRAAALGQAARMHALGTFAPESAARRYAMLYRSILADTTAQ